MAKAPASVDAHMAALDHPMKPARERLGAVGYLPERFGPRITLYARPGCESA